MKRIGTLLAAMLAATLGLVTLPAPEAHAQEDPYTTPGERIVNGREWRTSCEKYSTTVERCRAEIKATQVKFENGRFVEVTDWVFNNLTYKPSPRSQWEGNPLAADGKVGGTKEWTAEDGRQWRVECDTATTGRGGCRAYTMSTIYAVKTMTPRTYEQRNEWIFNNVVLFSPEKPTPAPPAKPVHCNNTDLPAGFALTDAGLPHAIKTPYAPNTLYNPTSISNFIRNAINLRRNLDANSQRAKDLKCLAELGAKHLMAGSETTLSADGKTVRWFPYMFRFSANPTMADLTGPWHSGLAQGGVLTTFALLADLTGDKAKWLGHGAETFRSFEVPISQPGGILNRDTEHGFLWFEEYPTKPLPTTVLNGHLEAVIGLNVWHRRMVAEGATAPTPPATVKALVDEALATLEPMLKLHEVPIDGGLLTSYDAVRGYPAAPLRFNGNGVRVAAQLNDKGVRLPATNATWLRDTYTSNGGFDLLGGPAGDPTMPLDWTRFGSPSNVVWRGDHMDVVSNGAAWQGFQQEVPPSWLSSVAGKGMTLTVRAQVTYPSNRAGASGRVAIFNDCPAGRTLLYENVLRGSGQWADYTFGFTAPPAGCGMLVQFMVSPWQNVGTRLLVDDVHISQAEPLGTSLAPQYDLKVYNTPVNTMQLSGSGTGTLQAYYNNRWQNIETLTLTNEPVGVLIPERFTGRNIHLGYHETHVNELMSLYRSFPQHKFLLTYAQRWAPMAPSQHHTVPKPMSPASRGVSTAGLSEYQVGDETVVLPDVVDQFTGLPYERLEHLDELEQPAS